jgi:cardiolipin synthase
MIVIHGIFLLIYFVVTIFVIIAVVMDNRQPVKTMAWVLVLLFMPGIGIMLYFFFGQNTRKEKLISQKSIDQLTKRSMLEFIGQPDLRLPESHKGVIQLFMNQNLAFPFKDNEVSIYTDGYQFIPALLAEIHKAKESIHLQTYIIGDDPVGRLVSDALIAKSHEGVEVRVIYDDVGCWRVKNKFFERLKEEEIEVRSFLPVRFPQFTSKVNYRNHRKLCVIDGRVGFIGGMNLALRYVKGEKEQAWRDTHLKIRGGAVYGLQRTFLMDWFFVDRTLITSRKYYPPVDDNIHNNCIAQIVTCSPVSPWPDIMQGYVRIINEAKRYVYMETPYFLPTEPVLFAMQTAALSGVDIRLMVPRKTDSHFLNWASRTYVNDVIASGVKIYLYDKGFLHSKLLICDDSLSTCGSTNIDFRSFENNLEVNVFFYDEGMALRLKSVFMNDMKNCFLLNSVPQKKLPFLFRMWESIVRVISPML